VGDTLQQSIEVIEARSLEDLMRDPTIIEANCVGRLTSYRLNFRVPNPVSSLTWNGMDMAINDSLEQGLQNLVLTTNAGCVYNIEIESQVVDSVELQLDQTIPQGDSAVTIWLSPADLHEYRWSDGVTLNSPQRTLNLPADLHVQGFQGFSKCLTSTVKLFLTSSASELAGEGRIHAMRQPGSQVMLRFPVLHEATELRLFDRQGRLLLQQTLAPGSESIELDLGEFETALGIPGTAILDLRQNGIPYGRIRF